MSQVQKFHISLTVIELTNWDMPMFLLTSPLSAFSILSKNVKPFGPFSVVVEDVPIKISMGVEPAEDGAPKGFTRLHFDYNIDTDLSLLLWKPSPILIEGDGASTAKAGGDIGMVQFIGDTDTAELYSHEETALLDAQ